MKNTKKQSVLGIFGYNAIMAVILNENRDDETKLQAIQMLIDKVFNGKIKMLNFVGFGNIV